MDISADKLYETPQKVQFQKPSPGNNNDTQTHVHEFLGSVMLAEEGEDRHNHRFAGVSSEVIPLPATFITSVAIPVPGNHIHGIFTNTDFFENHHHEIAVETGPAIWVSDTKHVHFVHGSTTLDDGHVHQFIFATLIENPLLNEKP